MPNALSRLALAVSAGLVVACSSKDAATEGAATGSPPATGDAPNIAPGAEPTANDISNYKLDMDKMRKYVAANKNLAAAAKDDPTAMADNEANSNNQSTAQMIARLESHPAAKRALSQAGLTAKDYVWITAAWLQAAMTQGILDGTPGAKAPEGQNMQNVDFLRANKAELEAMMSQLEGMNN
jgi:hypothetical protein